MVAAPSVERLQERNAIVTFSLPVYGYKPMIDKELQYFVCLRWVRDGAVGPQRRSEPFVERHFERDFPVVLHQLSTMAKEGVSALFVGDRRRLVW